MPSYFDAHIHLSDPRIANDLKALLEEANQKGIRGWVGGGTEPVDWERQRMLKQSGISLLTAFGLHPWWVAKESEATLESHFHLLEKLSSQSDAIGETGLDRAQGRGDLASFATQVDYFRRHLELAKRGKKPLVLHIVRAHAEAVRELKALAPFPEGGIVHSFSQEWEVAKNYLDLGFLLSFGAQATRASDGLQETLRKVPAERFVVETDAPDQPPFVEGKRIAQLNRPVFLLHMAEAVGKWRNRSAEAILTQSTDNLTKLFGMDHERKS